VIDTQYIYKIVRDTQYIHAPADTVYISVSDTKYIQLPADTVYVSDTSSIPVIDQPKAGTVKAVSDTLIFTSGTLDSLKSSTQPDSFRSKKKEEKAKVKKEKKEAEEKQKQYQKEQMEKAKQNKKLLKEKKEQEKKAKKEQAEKDKQFKRQQKENAKQDKEELKKMEACLPVKQFDGQFDTCIVKFAVFVTDKYAEIKDMSADSIS
jgi:flagellar biosynthesis GTPase FlhF